MDDLAVQSARAGLPVVIGTLQGLRYRVLGGDPPRISSTAIAVMSAGQLLDGSKAREALGFAAEVLLEDALRRTLGWFRAQGYVAPEG